MPGDVNWARLKLAKRGIHDAELAASGPAAAVSVERRQRVHVAADVAEVLTNAPADGHSAVPSRLHQYDFIRLFAPCGERLRLAILHRISWYNKNACNVVL